MKQFYLMKSNSSLIIKLVHKIFIFGILLCCFSNINAQEWHYIPKRTSVYVPSLLSQFDNDNESIHRIGLGFDNGDNAIFPSALLHIKAVSESLTPLKIDALQPYFGGTRNIGSIEHCSYKQGKYFGIFQTSSNGDWYNYFQNRVGIGVTEPGCALDVSGDGSFRSLYSKRGLYFIQRAG
jgi:hypothetical protein